MFSTERKVQGLYRHKIDLIVNWAYLMDRKELKSGDPRMILSLRYGESKNWTKLRDIQLYKNHTPFCQEEITIDYFQDTTHYIKLETENLKGDKDFKEPRIFTIENIMIDPSHSFNFKYAGCKIKQPEVNITTRWRLKDDYVYYLDIKVNDVKDLEWMSKTDPYVRILRLSPKYAVAPKVTDKIPPEDWYMIAYSEVVMDDLNPDFKPFVLPSCLLCDNKPSWPLRMELWDYEKGNDSPHRYIGRWNFTIEELLSKEKEHGTFLDEAKNSVGRIVIQKFEAQRQYDIQDCFSEGLEFNTLACIDYSDNNGKIGSPGYLHEISNESWNIYQKAIMSVMPSFFLYDQDKKIPLYGLSAKFPALSIDEKDFFKILGRSSGNHVPDSAEMMNYFYMSSFTYTVGASKLALAPCLRHIIDWVKDQTKNRPYFYTTAVIFIGGKISDLTESFSLIQGAENLALSFILVDMSNSQNFMDLMMLQGMDNDDLQTKVNGKLFQRDLVQYVNFRKYEENPVEAIYEIMSELPRQIIQYFQKNNLFHKK